MRLFVLLPVFLLSAGKIHAQTKDSLDWPKEFRCFGDMPQFPCGNDSLLRYVMSHIRLPDSMGKKLPEGKRTVRFVVNEDGRVSNAEIMKGTGDPLDKEIIRVVLSMPKWKPGTQSGRPVKAIYYLPLLLEFE